MEYVCFTILGLKTVTKSDLEKIFLKFLHAQTIFFWLILLSRKEEFCIRLQIQ